MAKEVYVNVPLDMLKRIERDFTYHAPSEQAAADMQLIRDKCKELAMIVANLTPVCREQSVAIGHIEQVSMYANAAIVRNEK